MTRLSVNINKIATLRNARGGQTPNVLQFALDAERFGAQGITVHPRPDERHITTQDCHDLHKHVHTEFNIEGYPDARYLQLIKDLRPAQATLVPDPPGVLTSNAGWNCTAQATFLEPIIAQIQALGVRVSLFMETDLAQIDKAKALGADRIEFYTGPYAEQFAADRHAAVEPYRLAALHAHALGLGINAGHDLSLENLAFLKASLVALDEVSIGHALISDALYLGIENTIQRYLYELREDA
ncbi:MAG: pyridoxine 5'-phosphate synthase [Crocinitomicaceae bacterium]|nr:pyridoxine 5'-phosphate synthase [Crocinitomicaceae bacterium]MDP4723469.1 pyridoxine 5'-phosphate synthase [Crocinitomicaceae bacterium]MDP4805683.1 pyridoxine 5'-phosphate synthase [Crocinitomicaceae bacterium]MDP4867628.1 pyridoxine 5'-phosphate synthase [Crocinitomicaceae bacterium]MDP5043027.1 pyridoxine 5'-phosphate synthase [Crocinitomicaceae bacterium]